MAMISLVTMLAYMAAATAGNPAPASLSAGLAPQKRDSWGGAFSLGPTTSKIIRSETVLTPGLPPTDPQDVLFLWPGMSNGTGDLIQTTLEQWASNSWCGATSDQWCVRASLFGSFGQIDGDGSPVSADQGVRIVYTRSDDGLSWTQNVTDATTGEQLSTLTHDSGDMTGWGTGTECDESCVGTISTQTYTETTITLESEDPSFSDTATTSDGVTYESMSSSDGGKTWTVGTITIPPMVSS